MRLITVKRLSTLEVQCNAARIGQERGSFLGTLLRLVQAFRVDGGGERNLRRDRIHV